MPQGWQAFDASGNLIVDVSTRLGRVLGVQTLTAATGGSVTNANFASGTPFWMLSNVSVAGARQPEITFSGTTLSWSFPGVGWSGETYRLVYGVY